MTGKKKLLVIGASGLLGSKLYVQAAPKYDVSGSYNPEVDGRRSHMLDPFDIASKE